MPTYLHPDLSEDLLLLIQIWDDDGNVVYVGHVEMGNRRRVRQLFDESLCWARINGVNYPLTTGNCRIHSKQHHSLPNAKRHSNGNDTRFPSRCLTSKHDISWTRFTPPIPLNPALPVCIACIIENEATHLDIGCPYNQVLLVVDNRSCLVGRVDNLLDDVT